MGLIDLRGEFFLPSSWVYEPFWGYPFLIKHTIVLGNKKDIGKYDYDF